jgi:hypothetical protein
LSSPDLRISFPELWQNVSFEAPVIFTAWLDDRAYGILGREPTLDHITYRLGHQDGYGFSIRPIR